MLHRGERAYPYALSPQSGGSESSNSVSLYGPFSQIQSQYCLWVCSSILADTYIYLLHMHAQCIAKSTFDLEFSEVAAEFGLLNEDSSACSPGLHGNETDDHGMLKYANLFLLSLSLLDTNYL